MSEKSRFLDEPVELCLTVHPKLAVLIDDLADLIGKDDSGAIIAIAISFLKIAVDAGTEGNRIAIMDGELEEVIQEILIPGFETPKAPEEAKS